MARGLGATSLNAGGQRLMAERYVLMAKSSALMAECPRATGLRAKGYGLGANG